jgi:metal-sulfur cluster biosynthetic enzyme
MDNHDNLIQAVQTRLSLVLDPETGIDVIRMGLVRDMQIDAKGNITYTFRPSSPICPIAVPLALSIIQAISEVPGISKQGISVIDYIQADELTKTLQLFLKDRDD